MNICQIDQNSKEEKCCTLAENERYSFFYCRKFAQIPLNSIAALPLSGTLRFNSLEVPEDNILLASAESFTLEGEEFLVGGVRDILTPEEKLIPLSQVKKVSKPWGYELWYSGEGRPFAFKKLFISSEKRLSLQYHQKKRETQFLYDGQMKLHSYHKKFTGPQDIDLDQIEQQTLSSMASIDIVPMTLHRMEAISDTTIFEVSTPELDDVVRVQDDTYRP